MPDLFISDMQHLKTAAKNAIDHNHNIYYILYYGYGQLHYWLLFFNFQNFQLEVPPVKKKKHILLHNDELR